MKDKEFNPLPSDAALLQRLQEELSKPRVDVDRLRSICISKGIPHELRGEIWQHLLGVYKKETNVLEAWDGLLDLPCQWLIKADCQRTRQGLKEFKTAERQEEMERLLTLYCKRRSVSYVQGLNELLAPLLMLNLPRGVVFNCFYSIISKFLPNIFTDDKFLPRCLILLRMLLLYHDPSLCLHLDGFNASPDMYAVPWFLTLFARSLDVEMVFAVWDFFLLENDPLLPYFFGVSLLANNREKLMKAHVAMLPETLVALTITTQDEARSVCTASKLYDSETPRSFRRLLLANIFTKGTSNQPTINNFGPSSSFQSIQTEAVYETLQALACLPVSAAEALGRWTLVSASSSSTTSGRRAVSPAPVLKFFVIDCRPSHELEYGRVPTAIHIDPKLLEKPHDLEEVIGRLSSIRGSHLAFLGSGDPAATEVAVSSAGVGGSEATSKITQQDTTVVGIVMAFLRHGFPHISIIDQGYAGCHALFLNKMVDLADHVANECPICITSFNLVPPPRPNPNASGGLLDRLREKNKGGSLFDKMSQGASMKSRIQAAAQAALKESKESLKETQASMSAFLKERRESVNANLGKVTNKLETLKSTRIGRRESTGDASQLSPTASRRMMLSSSSPPAPDTPDDFQARFTLDEADDEVQLPHQGLRGPSFNRPPQASGAVTPSQPELPPLQDDSALGCNDGEVPDEVAVPFDIESVEKIPLGMCIPVSHWMHLPDVSMFPCQRVNRRTNTLHPMYIVISPKYFLSIEAHRLKLGWAYVRSQHHLSDILRITFARSQPSRLTFEMAHHHPHPQEATLQPQKHDDHRPAPPSVPNRVSEMYVLPHPATCLELIRHRLAQHVTPATTHVPAAAGQLEADVTSTVPANPEQESPSSA